MPSSSDVDAVVHACAVAGLDLTATTAVGTYNALVDEPYWLPGAADSLVIVIGNSRELWAHLDRFVLAHPHPMADPVDTYVETVVGAAVAGRSGVVDVRYAHEPPPRRIAIQRLADVAGMAWLSPSHLCVHPTFGPWIALRAAVVLDLPALHSAPATPAAPCVCAEHCLPMLDEALAAGDATSTDVIEHWRRWVALRDACPVGRPYRYTEEQIAYHYVGQRPERWPG